MNHFLKTDSKPFQAVLSGRKTFEWRLNDRGFEIGDQLTLKEINSDKVFTGRQCKVHVTYILKSGYGIPDGYCVMAITKPNEGVNVGINIDNYADMDD